VGTDTDEEEPEGIADDPLLGPKASRGHQPGRFDVQTERLRAYRDAARGARPLPVNGSRGRPHGLNRKLLDMQQAVYPADLGFKPRPIQRARSSQTRGGDPAEPGRPPGGPSAAERWLQQDLSLTLDELAAMSQGPRGSPWAAPRNPSEHGIHNWSADGGDGATPTSRHRPPAASAANRHLQGAPQQPRTGARRQQAGGEAESGDPFSPSGGARYKPKPLPLDWDSDSQHPTGGESAPPTAPAPRAERLRWMDDEWGSGSSSRPRARAQGDAGWPPQPPRAQSQAPPAGRRPPQGPVPQATPSSRAPPASAPSSPAVGAAAPMVEEPPVIELPDDVTVAQLASLLSAPPLSPAPARHMWTNFTHTQDECHRCFYLRCSHCCQQSLVSIPVTASSPTLSTKYSSQCCCIAPLSIPASCVCTVSNTSYQKQLRSLSPCALCRQCHCTFSTLQPVAVHVSFILHSLKNVFPHRPCLWSPVFAAILKRFRWAPPAEMDIGALEEVMANLGTKVASPEDL
jgi:hypothetical protein